MFILIRHCKADAFELKSQTAATMSVAVDEWEGIIAGTVALKILNNVRLVIGEVVQGTMDRPTVIATGVEEDLRIEIGTGTERMNEKASTIYKMLL